MTGFAEGKPISWAVGGLDGPSTGLGDAAGSRLPLPTPSLGKLLGGGGWWLVPVPLYVIFARGQQTGTATS